MNNDLDNFSLGVKRALEGINPPVDINAWDRFEQRLNEVEANAQFNSSKKGNGFNSGLISGIGVAASIFVASFIAQQNDTGLQAIQQPHQVETIAEVSDMKQTVETQSAETAVITVVEVDNKVLSIASNSAKEIETQNTSLDVSSSTEIAENSAAIESTSQETIPAETTNGNVKQTPKEVEPNNNESITISIANQTICLGQPLGLTTSTQNGIWVVDGIQQSTDQPELYTPGAHQIAYQVGSEISNIINVIVSENPSASFDYQLDKDQFGRPVIEFVSASLNGYSNKWILKSEIQTQSEFSKVYEKQGEYPVQLITTNENGCADTASKLITIDKDYNLLAPTAFSPNGDGINDTWMPQALLHGDVNFRVMIFSKSGNLVFESTSSDRPWDGMINGKPAQVGEVFVWKATAQLDENTNEYGGVITIYNR